MEEFQFTGRQPGWWKSVTFQFAFPKNSLDIIKIIWGADIWYGPIPLLKSFTLINTIIVLTVR